MRPWKSSISSSSTNFNQSVVFPGRSKNEWLAIVASLLFWIWRYALVAGVVFVVVSFFVQIRTSLLAIVRGSLVHWKKEQNEASLFSELKWKKVWGCLVVGGVGLVVVVW